MSLLSKRLYELRKSHNLTLQALYLKTGISMASLSAYERDKYAPTIENLCKLADFYETTVDALLTKPESSDIFTVPEERHIR